MISGNSGMKDNHKWLMVVADATNAQALTLIEQLRAAHFTVVVATTIEMAARADAAAACIVVLDAEHWRDNPAITTAIRCNPRCLIPLVTAPMTLPRGNWTTAEVLIKEPLSETVTEIEGIITPVLAQPATIKQASPATNFAPPKRRSKYRSKLLLEYGILALVVVIVVIVVYFIAPGATKSSVINSASSLPLPYSVDVPGPQCDKGNASWRVASNYKLLPTATAVNPSATATSTYEQDSSTTTTCQSDGLLVQHNEHFNTYATIIYSNGAQALPGHFKTQITAKAVSTSYLASFELKVQGQRSDQAYDLNSGYGNDDLSVYLNGHWYIRSIDDHTDLVDAYLAQGFVAPANTYTLASEVDGPLLSFWINGKKISTVVDTTYAHGYNIGFGVADGVTKTPPSALFSHFSYTPLATDAKQKTEIAAVQAQRLKDKQSVYSAQVPGFGCDTNGGQWRPAIADQNYATTSCHANGLQASQPATTDYIGDIEFFDRDGNLPTDYQIQASIASLNQPGNCAGIATRQSQQGSSYNFLVCQDGYWQIIRYLASDGSNTRLDEGSVNVSSTYTLITSAKGSQLTLSINGKQVSTVTDSSLATTNHVSLVVESDHNTAPVLFSNFIFTPLS